MMKNKNTILIGILAISIVIIIAGCSQSEHAAKAAQEGPIEIGVIAPLTGEVASYGLAAKEGLDFAVKEINNGGGILGRQVKLIYEDSQFNQKQVVSILSKFINVNKLDIIIIADGSGPTIAAAPIAEAAQTLVMATLASTPQLSSMGDYIFRTVPSDSYQGMELAKFADDKNFKTAAILYAHDPYGVGIKDVFSSEFSGTVIIAEAFENSDSDFRTQLTKIKHKNPDVILLVARKELPNILKQIRTLEIESALIGSETTKDQELADIAGEAAKGLYSIFFAEPVDYVRYREKFSAEYGKEPAAYSDYSYDAVHVLKKAITAAESLDPTKIKDSLYTTKMYGATGIVEFDSNGDVINKQFTMYEVVEGKFVAVTS